MKKWPQLCLLGMILFFCVLQLVGIWANAIDVAFPLLGIYQLLSGAVIVRKDPDSGFISLLTGGIILLIFIAGFLPV